MSRNSKIFKRKLARYFKQRLGMWDYRRGWMKGTCPQCGKEKKYGVNIENNRTNCFKCGYNKQPIDVIVDLELEVSNRAQALLYIGAFEEADYLETPKDYLPEKETKLPEGYMLITLGRGRLGKMAREYMKGRGFNLTELMLKGIGYCRSGKYMGRIILPFYEAGNIVYFNARKFMGGGRKFDNPTIDELGIGKSMLIYNVDALELYETVYITESATNSLTLGDNALGGGGKIFSTYQISKILQSPVKKVIIILDPDAWKEAIRLGMELVSYKKVKVVKLPEKLYLRPEGKGVKVDINAIGRKRTLKYVKQSPWVSYMELVNMKMDHERAEYTHYKN